MKQKKTFISSFTRTPVVRRLLADLDTPLTAYMKLVHGPYGYLFESVQGGEKWGRYSIIGLPCRHRIRVDGQIITLEAGNCVVDRIEVDDPLHWIEIFQSRFEVPEVDDLPRFTGGLVGYFGYDTVAYIESRLRRDTPKPDPLQTPDILLMVSEEVVIFDNLSGCVYLVVNVDPSKMESAEKRLDELEADMRDDTPRYHAHTAGGEVSESDFQSGFTEAGFKAAVGKARDYIIDGDIMQVVLSQRMSIPFNAPPLNLYRALRNLNPSPYMYFLDFDEFQVVGSSPEILVRLEDDDVTVRPIAGTRRRGRTPEDDVFMENDLLGDPKEIAEHLMLIDLGRNDTARVSRTGSVELTEKMIVERYSHVMHIVSNVKGRLRENLRAMDVLRATFPAGTVSGAPKIRAMEIIDELEPVKRGVYSGAVGYLAWNGNMDVAIAIRTAIIKHNVLHLQCGAGIVYDSKPELEWMETMNKGRAVFKAVEMAESGLDCSKTLNKHNKGQPKVESHAPQMLERSLCY